MTGSILLYVSLAVYFAETAAWIVYTTGRLTKHQDSPAVSLAYTIGAELRPFMLPSIVGQYLGVVLIDGHISALNVFTLLLQVWVWWRSRNDFDDRWKRRAKRLAEKVQSAGHKLVVVEAGAES